MKIKDNQRLQAEEENNSKLFKDDVNYEQPSEDRPYFYWVGKTKLYVNLEQLKFLRQDYWDEKTENWKKSRCLIRAERGEWKICKAKCEECPSFRNGWMKPTFTSFEDMDEENYLNENPQQSILDKIIEEERLQAMYDAIDNLDDPIDRYIMRQYLLETKDLDVALKIGKSRQTVITRRNKCIEDLKKILKNF